MTTKVIVDNHGRFTINIDHVQGSKIVSTDTIMPDQSNYETIIHSGKHVIIREVHEGVNSTLGILTFGLAVEALKLGKKVARSGWNGKGLTLLLQVPDENSKMTLPYIYMQYPTTPASDTAPSNHLNARVPWLASQTDVLAEDWEIVE